MAELQLDVFAHRYVGAEHDPFLSQTPTGPYGAPAHYDQGSPSARLTQPASCHCENTTKALNVGGRKKVGMHIDFHNDNLD
jgi:hypothetical protein